VILDRNVTRLEAFSDAIFVRGSAACGDGFAGA
jgi:hypothetical protein